MPTCTTKIVLYTSHKLKNGFHPLKLRVTCQSKTRYINLGEYMLPHHWDERRQWISKTHPSFAELDLLLQTQLKQANDRLYALRLRQEDFSLDDALETITNKHPDINLSQYYWVLIERLERSHRLGTARSYRGALQYLVKANQGKELLWSTVTVKWLNTTETAHLERVNSLNSLSVNYRSLRSVINQGISEGVYCGENPFARYRIKQTDTRKRALSLNALQKLKHLELSQGDPLAFHRDLFFASFYLQGMNFSDISQLRQSNIVEDRLEYTRQKVGNHLSVKITPPLQEILDRYHPQANQDFLFPILDDKSPISLYTQGMYANKRFNKALKKLAAKSHLPPFTGYAARHSWASLANERKIPLTAITHALGQRSVRTTQIYLDELSRQATDATTERMSEI